MAGAQDGGGAARSALVLALGRYAERWSPGASAPGPPFEMRGACAPMQDTNARRALVLALALCHAVCGMSFFLYFRFFFFFIMLVLNLNCIFDGVNF